jgi:hypothetical protein
MKKLILISTVLLAFQASLAQSFKMNKLYAQGGIGGASGKGVSTQIGIRTVFNNKWTFTATKLYFERNAKTPDNYVGEINYAAFFLPGFIPIELYPIANTDLYYLSAGRFFPLTRSVYFTIDAGAGVAKGQKFSFLPKGISPETGKYAHISDNYSVTADEVSSFGGVIRAGLDIAFTNFAGIGFDAYYNINGGGINDQVGMNLKLIVGWMNRGPKAKKSLK